jgi:hypothetical protein
MMETGPVAHDEAGRVVELWVRRGPTAAEAFLAEYQATKRLFGRLYGPAR